MKKLIVLLISLVVMQTTSAQMSQWEENFVRQYDPQTYSYYKFGEGIANQGKQIANSLTQQLSSYQNLIDTQDPDALLADFQSKMQNIQSLEDSYIQKANTFAYNSGQQIGNAINNKDAMGAISGLIGFGSQMKAQKEAKRKLEQQKAALKQQRIDKMSQVYWKAKKFNETKIEEYINRAAFARNLKDEKYNLAFVDNLECYAKSMKDSWSSYHTRWLQNNCAKPKKPSVNTIENKFVAKDIQVRRVAERKYKFYEKSGYEQFKTAAISYAAAAAKAKGSAANYFLLGKYYVQENPILGLSTLLTVKQINPNYKKTELDELIASATKSTESDITKALSDNDVAYLNSFLDAGLDRLIKIDGKSILTEAIALDKPDAVQTILNKYIDGLSQEKINEKIQKTLMLCALKDSEKTIKRFANLGVSVDFKLGKYHPIDLAIKGNATNAYETLLSLSEQADSFKEKYKDSDITIFMDIENNPIQAAKDIDAITDVERKNNIIQDIYSKSKSDDNMFAVIMNSKEAISYIKSDATLLNEMKKLFVDEIKTASPQSKSAKIYKAGFVSFSKMPIYGDFLESKKTIKVKSKIKNKDEQIVIESFEEVLSNQIEATKKLGLSQYQVYIKQMEDMQKELQNIKTSGTEMTKEQRNKYIGMSFTFIANNHQNLYAKYRKPYERYIRANYEVKDEVPLKEKAEVIYTAVKKSVDDSKDEEFKKNMAMGMSIWKSYSERENFTAIEKMTINGSYPPHAFGKNKPIDEASMAAFGKQSNTYSVTSPQVSFGKLNNKSLALVSFASDNYELFSALDAEFDLSEIKEDNGLSLLDNMLKDSKKITMNSAYMSSEFNFKNRDVIKNLIKSLSENSIYPSKETFKPVTELIKKLDMENYPISNSGGTFLHWFVENLVKQSNEETTEIDWENLQHIASELNIDKSMLNDNAMTAYQMFDSNASSIKKYWKKENKKALGGGGLINGMANKMMRKDKEKKIEAMLKPN